MQAGQIFNSLICRIGRAAISERHNPFRRYEASNQTTNFK